jgi:glycosyltransferase involved in cell wall biosynthesis
MIKISVIVPIYNMEKYLEKCLDSLLSQTLEEIEIICVDDGSKDASPEILKRYAEKSAKIISLRKENGGLSDARNYGLPYATGEYIGYLDSDDFVDTDMYEIMYNKAKEQGSDIVECNLHHTYQDYEDTEVMGKY